MRYTVTGGEDGTAGIDVGSRRYEPGDIVELTQSKAGWLVDRGLLVPVSGRAAKDNTSDNTDETEVSNWENPVAEDDTTGGDE